MIIMITIIIIIIILYHDHDHYDYHYYYYDYDYDYYYLQPTRAGWLPRTSPAIKSTTLPRRLFEFLRTKYSLDFFKIAGTTFRSMILLVTSEMYGLASLRSLLEIFLVHNFQRYQILRKLYCIRLFFTQKYNAKCVDALFFMYFS